MKKTDLQVTFEKENRERIRRVGQESHKLLRKCLIKQAKKDFPWDKWIKCPKCQGLGQIKNEVGPASEKTWAETCNLCYGDVRGYSIYKEARIFRAFRF